MQIERKIVDSNEKRAHIRQITVRQQINRKLEVLPANLQKKVLYYINHLIDPGIPRGVPGKKLVKLAGSLSEEDSGELIQIIEEGCERILRI